MQNTDGHVGELGGSGEHDERRRHQLQLAVDVVGEVARHLLNAAVELLGLRPGLAGEQQAGRHQHRHIRLAPNSNSRVASRHPVAGRAAQSGLDDSAERGCRPSDLNLPNRHTGILPMMPVR